MRVVADVPVQKIIAMGGEIFGLGMSIHGLQLFLWSCLNPMQSRLTGPGISATYWSGPAFYCFAFSTAVGGFRMILHILTPVPKRGSLFLEAIEYGSDAHSNRENSSFSLVSRASLIMEHLSFASASRASSSIKENHSFAGASRASTHTWTKTTKLDELEEMEVTV
jgi:hypothetical protein